MQGKGKQHVAEGRRVMLAFPGGAGYGDASQRDPEMVKRDLARGYISAEAARENYGMSADAVDAVLAAVAKGDTA